MWPAATNIMKVRLFNLWAAFEAVRTYGPIARARISDITGLSKQATSDLVNELLSLGFVRTEKSTKKPSERGVGKPSTPIVINSEGAFTIGLHVDFGQQTAVAVNLAGEILGHEAGVLDDLEPAAAARDIGATAARLLGSVDLDRSRLLGIGLATPGPFAVAGLSPPRLPGWDGVDIRERLHRETALPVLLANDGQCAITAEWRFANAARTLSNFVYVYLGMGVGSGIMVHGAAFGGASGNAGEFGHTTVVPGGHPCICGKRGCLETYVSVDSALRYLAAHGIEVGSMQELSERFDATHPVVAAWIEEGTEPLRIGLNTIENLFDPQTIMLGGNAPAWLIDAFIERVLPLYPSIGRPQEDLPRLMKAELGADAISRGAAALPVLAVLNPQYQMLNAFGSKQSSQLSTIPTPMTALRPRSGGHGSLPRTTGFSSERRSTRSR